MEREADKLPAPPPLPSNLSRPIVPEYPHLRPSLTSTAASTTTTTSTTTLSSSSSPPSFLRHVQAAFKRHRPQGMMQSNNIKPRRMLVPQRKTSKGSTLSVDPTFNTKKTQDEYLLNQRLRDYVSQSKNMVSVIAETSEDASITPPSEWGSTVNTHEEHFKSFVGQNDEPRSFDVSRNNATVGSDILESEQGLLVEGQKKVHFAKQIDVRIQEMEWDAINHTEVPTALSQDLQDHNVQTEEVDGSLRPESGISSSLERNSRVSGQLHQFRDFLQDDMSHPMTQSSVVGTSCATTTLINPGSAPVLNSTTYCSKPYQMSSSFLGSEIMGDVEMKFQPIRQGDVVQLLDPASKCPTEIFNDGAATAAQVPSATAESKLEVKESILLEKRQASVPKECDTSKNPSQLDDCSAKESVIGIPSGASLSKAQSSDVKLEPNKAGRQEKAVGGKSTSTSRKKNYDADLFFKVNGKPYQRLGKIGSGGSSEVHKVISSDCLIYALKKIKLKGRDYATAYGFCQEIEYLNKLKGKNHIIQLIDYEVTDKALFQEVTSGSLSNKDGRVREDGYIYMVLEYGEIDLAHMLSQKWKELDSSNSTIDENWLRFYWQQILLAVNTIHEERIVHSDLKPANFLLVRGSLKLIDFGIAKAIMSDTTNIQRDSQVGTLSYMSPEAFLCNESDANGNIIKCGRPSDIWSLGCILYQMVYGRTPFSEYKTFWAKFKVITDPNHEITYEPVSNPWLMDLMKKCLAWDRNERWRIPQLLQHPFLVPPIPPQLSAPLDQSCKLLQLIAESCKTDQRSLMLCSQIEQLLRDPRPSIPSQTSISQEDQHKLLCDMSKLCLQLNDQLANLGKDTNKNW